MKRLYLLNKINVLSNLNLKLNIKYFKIRALHVNLYVRKYQYF